MSTGAWTMGEVAYEAYRKSSDGRSLVSGKLIPPWGMLDDKIREAWIEAAMAVKNYERRRDGR